MGPRKVHKVRLGKYKFMREFLTKEWSVVTEERGNVDTVDNASIDAVWDSFQHFLELNGYSHDFCSKILLGKLLHEAGVEKVKRGPRKRQKFYYFPLKPVLGSKAETILSTDVSARYNTNAYYSNMNKIKPEYYTIRSSCLGTVSIGVLYDRAMTPEKYASKMLKKMTSSKANKHFRTDERKLEESGVITTENSRSGVSFEGFRGNILLEQADNHNQATELTDKSAFEVTNVTQSDFNSRILERDKSLGADSTVDLSALFSDIMFSPTQDQSNCGVEERKNLHTTDDQLKNDLNNILCDSIVRMYDEQDMDEDYHCCNDDRYGSWDNCLNLRSSASPAFGQFRDSHGLILRSNMNEAISMPTGFDSSATLQPVNSSVVLKRDANLFDVADNPDCFDLFVPPQLEMQQHSGALTLLNNDIKTCNVKNRESINSCIPKRRNIGRPKGSKTNLDRLKKDRVGAKYRKLHQKKEKAPRSGLFCTESQKGKQSTNRMKLVNENNVENLICKSHKRCRKNNPKCILFDQSLLLNSNTKTRIELNSMSRKRARGRPKGSKNKKPSKKNIKCISNLCNTCKLLGKITKCSCVKKTLLSYEINTCLASMPQYSSTFSEGNSVIAEVADPKSFYTTADFKQWGRRGRKTKASDEQLTSKESDIRQVGSIVEQRAEEGYCLGNSVFGIYSDLYSTFGHVDSTPYSSLYSCGKKIEGQSESRYPSDTVDQHFDYSLDFETMPPPSYNTATSRAYDISDLILSDMTSSCSLVQDGVYFQTSPLEICCQSGTPHQELITE